jgi:hypothetical protein
LRIEFAEQRRRGSLNEKGAEELKVRATKARVLRLIRPLLRNDEDGGSFFGLPMVVDLETGVLEAAH